MKKAIVALAVIGALLTSCEKDITYQCDVLTVSMGNIKQSKKTFTGTKKQKEEYERDNTTETTYVTVNGITYNNKITTTCK